MQLEISHFYHRFVESYSEIILLEEQNTIWHKKASANGSYSSMS